MLYSKDTALIWAENNIDKFAAYVSSEELKRQGL